MLPSIGSRISLRYRSGPGEHTDVIGVLESTEPVLHIRTKSDGVVSVAPEAVTAVKEISYKPIRASEIRALEHAAAMAWPGVQQQWHDGWFLRAGHGVTTRANSAVPLDFSAGIDALPAIAEWYEARALPAWLLLPERLLPVRADGIKQTRVMVGEVSGVIGDVELTTLPDADWLAVYQRDVPTDVLTAVVDGQVVFAAVAGSAVGRGAVTTAPDGTGWVGISAVRVAVAQRRQGHARRVCGALLDWGAGHGAQRAYVEVLADNAPAIELYASMGFRLHHTHRYVEARSLGFLTI